MTKLDILAIGVHPDDVELRCAGTIMKHIDQGHAVGILHLTKGELGTRGTPELRVEEARSAAAYMGVDICEQLDIGDGFFQNTKEHQIDIVRIIRRYQPEIVLANSVQDRHPDHERAAQLVRVACHLSGLVKVETTDEGVAQDRWRPRALYHFIQNDVVPADLCVNIDDYIERKMEAVRCYRSQFYNPNSDEPDSLISGADFLEFVKAQDRVFGRAIGAEFAEGYTVSRAIGIENLLTLH